MFKVGGLALQVREQRVYIEFLDCYGHIQKIEEKLIWVKREDKETCAQGFSIKSLKKTENLTLEQIAKYLEKEQENLGNVFQGQEYCYELGNVAWGMGAIAGEIIQNYWFLEWEQQEQDLRLNYNIPFQLCNRAFRVPQEIDINYLLKNSPFKDIEYSTFWKRKRTGNIYYVTELAIATGRFDGKKIVTYQSTKKELLRVSFCRILDEFLATFEKVNYKNEI